MKKTGPISVLALAMALALAGCGSDPAEDPVPTSEESTSGESNATDTPADQETAGENDILAAHGLSGLNVREVIETLDTMPRSERPSTLIASIRPNELLLTDDQGAEQIVPMPQDEFYVSFAPYISQTHPCHFHSLTTCTGELQNTEIRVIVTDNTTDSTLLDETVTTFDNGFYGVWLPRDIEGILTVEYDGLTAISEFSTSGDEDATCVTTLELTEI